MKTTHTPMTSKSLTAAQQSVLTTDRIRNSRVQSCVSPSKPSQQAAFLRGMKENQGDVKQ